MSAMIGGEPHKASHRAVAIDTAERLLGTLRVRASAVQAARLVESAAEWPERTWAVEGVGGLGHQLAQQLVAAGEQVVDVQPKLGFRVRLLSSGSSNKNDPNDARSVAIAALRSPVRQPVRAGDHSAVLKMWSKRHRDLSRLRCQAACRLDAMLVRAHPRRRAQRRSPRPPPPRWLGSLSPALAIAAARHELALAQLADLRRIDDQLRQGRTKLTTWRSGHPVPA